MADEVKMGAAMKAHIVACDMVDKRDMVVIAGDLYQYRMGVWEQVDGKRAHSMAASLFHQKFGPPTESVMREVFLKAEDRTHETYSEEMDRAQSRDKRIINTASGMFDIVTGAKTPYSKESWCFHRLPFDYVDGKVPCAMFFRFLTTSMGYDWDIQNDRPSVPADLVPEYLRTIRFIQEWLGYSLSMEDRFHKNLLMIGQGSNGKGTLIEIWQELLGKPNYSTVDIQNINDLSQIFLTIGKLVNFSPDLQEGQQLDSGILKQMTVREQVSYNQKYKEQRTNVRSTAKFVIACNAFPYIKTVSTAIKRRWHIVRFPRQFEGKDEIKDLKAILSGDMPAIFSWAVEGYRNLLARDDFEVPEKCKMEITKYLDEFDNIKLFMEENGVGFASPEHREEADRIYEQYSVWCKASGTFPLKKAGFYNQMESRGFPTKRRRDNSRYFVGMSVAKREMDISNPFGT